VRRDGSRLDAHAWVEVDGRPINERAEVVERFEILDEAIPHSLIRRMR
jgi:hypothetical protein